MKIAKKRGERKNKVIKALLGVRHKKGKGKSEEEKKAKPRWSDLPEDMMRNIMERLHWSDRIRLGMVCKSWVLPQPHHGIQIQIQSIDKLPWIMSYGRVRPNKLIFKLFDPCVQKTYNFEKGKEEMKDFFGAESRASKYGWVLFSKNINSTTFCHHSIFFLYSPFTNEAIELPEWHGESSFNQLTFCLDWRSPDCVVYGLLNKRRKFCIKTCRPGDQTWTDIKFDSNCQHASLRDVTYADGFYYCVFSDRKLAAFNVALQEWTAFTLECPKDYSNMHFIPCDGERDVRLLIEFEFHSEVWRFDLSKKHLVKEHNTDKHVWFLGYTLFSESAKDLLGSNKTRLRSYKLINIGTMCFSDNKTLLANFSESPSLADLYGWISYEWVKQIWIEPPFKGIWRAHDLLFRSN